MITMLRAKCVACYRVEPSFRGTVRDDGYYCSTCSLCHAEQKRTTCHKCVTFDRTYKAPCGHFLCEKHGPSSMWRTDGGHPYKPCRDCGVFECKFECHNLCSGQGCECTKCCGRTFCRKCFNIHKGETRCENCNTANCDQTLRSCKCCKKKMCLTCVPRTFTKVEICSDCYVSHAQIPNTSSCEQCRTHRCNGDLERCTMDGKCRTIGCEERLCRRCQPPRCQGCRDKGLHMTTRACTFCKQRKRVVIRRGIRCATPMCEYNAAGTMCTDCRGSITRLHKLTRDSNGKFYCDDCNERIDSYIN